MARVNNKEVKAQCTQMEDAWTQDAAGKTVDFNGIARTALAARISDGAQADSLVADLEAQLSIARDNRDGIYIDLNDMHTRVGQGVAGNPDFGNDSPLYGAMGFVRKSDRASGLTRKTKTPSK